MSVDNVSEIPITSSLEQLQPTDKELSQSEWLLSTIGVDFGHIHVIDEDNHLLTRSFWTIVFKGSLVNIFLNDVLEVKRRSPG